MPADDYGRSLPKFSVNLLVRDVQASLPFYRDVLGATVRYADDDFTLWPQLYHVKYPHLAAVPKKPEDPVDPLSIMWWTPTVENFELAIGDREAGLGLITTSKRDQMNQLVDPLVIRIDNYREAAERPNTFLLLIAKVLKHAQARLNTHPAKFLDAKFGFVEVQRLYLEASGCIDYLETFIPVMDGKKPAATRVDETRMGTLTPDPETVQSFFRAGLPVWYIRRFDQIPTCNPPNVLSLVNALQPVKIVHSPSNPPFPLIYEGTDNLKKQDSIRNFTRTRMFYHDPFSDETSPRYAGAPRLPSHSIAVPAEKLLQLSSRPRQLWSASLQPSASSSLLSLIPPSPSSLPLRPSSRPSVAQKRRRGELPILLLTHNSLIAL